MARELPIHNGRMTTDLDANGFKIKNLPSGSGFTQAQADWNQADATAPDFIKNKPTIPAPVSVDATLTQSGAAADAKVTGDMLYTGFTPWKADSPLSGYVFESCVWKSSMSKWEVSWKAATPGGTGRTTLEDGAEDDVSITGSSPLAYALSRHLITPTKTSQLTNDGDGASPFAKVSQLPDVSGLAAKAELPYPFVPATVTQDGPWAFSDDGDYSVAETEYDETWSYVLSENGAPVDSHSFNSRQTSVEFSYIPSGESTAVTVTATRTGLLTITPRTVATFTADSSAASFTVAVGEGVAGAARDCVLIVDCTELTSSDTAPSITWPSNFHPRTDTATDMAIVEVGQNGGNRCVFYISEYAPGEFAVGGWQEEAE